MKPSLASLREASERPLSLERLKSFGTHDVSQGVIASSVVAYDVSVDVVGFDHISFSRVLV
jgi:hypothetical protein